MSTNASKILTVTAITDKGTDQITAFSNELPGLLVQGDSEDDIKQKLTSLLDIYIKRLSARKNNIQIQVH